MARQGNFFSFLADEESEVDPADLAAKIAAKIEEEQLKRLKEEEERLKRLKDEEERRLNPQYQPLTAATAQPLPPSQYVKSKTVGGGGGSGGGSGKSFRNHGEMNGYQGNNGDAGGYRRNNGGAAGYQHNYKGNGGAEGYRRNNGDGRGRGQKERTGRGYSRPPEADSTTGAGVGGNRGPENSQPQVAAALPSLDDHLHFPNLVEKAVKA